MRNRKRIALSLLLALGMGTQVLPALVFAMETRADAADMIEETISFKKTEGETNKFTFAPNGWEAGNDAHTWSKAPGSDIAASDIWYQVDFVGNAIEVYAGKNHPMGKVEYFIDGVSKGTFSLYNSYNIDKTKIAKFEGLSEGPHTFKAVATGERDTSSTNALIDCSDVVITHAPYAIESITPAENTLTLSEGATHKINATVTPSYASGSPLTYTSSNPDIASVDAKGVITARKTGTAEITVAAGTVQAKIAVSVEEAQTDIGGTIVDTNRQYPQNKYDTIKTQATLNKTLSAWKGDHAVSQFVVYSKDCKLDNVKLEATNFTDQKGNSIDASNVTMNFIDSTLAYNGAYLGYGSTTRPVPPVTETNRSESTDILSKKASVNIPFNALQPVWMEIAVPADTPAGTYTGTVKVTADELDTPMSFAYTLTVQDATLPALKDLTDSFDIELWQYPYSSAEYYGVEPFSEEHFEILKPIMELYKEAGGHAITASIIEDAWSGQTYSANDVHYPSMVKWTKNTDGSFSYDFTAFDKWVTFCRNEIGIGDKIVLYSIAPWGNAFTYWENGVLKSESFSAGTARYNEVWRDFLNKMIEHLDQKGWFDDTYMGIDERGFSAAAFDLIDSVQNIHGKSLKTAGAMDGFVNKRDLAMRVDDLNVGDNAAAAHPAEFDQLLKNREAAGKRTTLYSCTEHSPGNFALSAPVESYWTIINAGKETAGFLRWAYDAWVADPLRDSTHNAFEAGDTFLVYPDEKDAAKPDAFRSLRLARMMEGLRDVNKLRIIEKEVPGLAGEIQALYADIETRAGTSRSYLSDAAIDGMSDEMDTFKNGIAAISDKYIELKENGTDTIESVEIEADDTTIIAGQTMQLRAVVKPDNALNATVTWTSSNPKVATVSETGLVTAITQGSIEITATSKADPTKSATIKLRVEATAIPKDALMASYSFNDTLEDGVGERHGSASDGAEITFEKGRSANAVRLDASEGVVFAGDQSIGANDAWTLTYWVKADSISGKSLVTQDKDENFATALKMASDRNAGFRVGKGNGDVLTYNYNFQADNWYHLTWTQSKSDGLSMYVNGVLVQNNAWTKNNNTLIPADIVGKSDFTGLVDEMHVYNRILTQEEITADMAVPGLTILESSKTITTKDTWQIQASLLSDVDDDSIVYESLTPEIATVDEDGLVTPVKPGTATIKVSSASGKFTENVTVTINKYILFAKQGPYYDLPEEFQSTVHFSEDTSNQYFGQPDMIRTKTGRLITSFPQGHGHGPLIMKISDDNAETWTQKNDIPASWDTSQETPTMYVLNMPDGTERLMLITANPSWDLDRGGWSTSYSDDNGETWSEFKHFHQTFENGDKRRTIVAMSSLVQLKDEEGNLIPKWMGIFHDYSYTNYKTILSFDENGNEQWSEPEAFLADYRGIESTYQMCEIGMFRSPDGKRIVGLARSQSHNNPSTMIYSDDEGKTWCKPIDLPGNLAGERHKAVYDPISGRLFITFRDIKFDLNGNNQFDGGSDWTCGEWTAWVGTYEDLMNLEQGDYLINLDYDWANSYYSGDTGYTGLVVLEDGTIIGDTYGHWDKEFSESWTGGTTSDRCYIRQVKFKLGAFEEAAGLVNKDALKAFVDEHNPTAGEWTNESFAAWTKALNDAKAVLDSKEMQQVQVDNALKALEDAFNSLKPAEGQTVNTSVLELVVNTSSNMTSGENAKHYTETALNAFRTAIDKAAAVLANAAASQADVDSAADELHDDLLNLRMLPDEKALEELKNSLN